MTTKKQVGLTRLLLRSTTALALVAGVALAPMPAAMHLGGQAQAQSGSGQGSGQGGTHGQTQRPANPGQSMKGMGTGKGGSSEESDSDKKGPGYAGGTNAAKPPPGTQGGRPVWAQEGIPAVELGRLSVARAPSHVITKALAEAVSNWTTMGTTVMTLTADGQPTLTMTVAQLYSLPAEQFANIVMTYYPSIIRIDSPLENLGLMQDLGKTGTTQLTGVTPASNIDLLAIFLGSASDKTLSISVDTVIAMTTLLAIPAMTTDQVAELAAKAEAVRLAILIGHDG
jgi:hypothetical protein